MEPVWHVIESPATWWLNVCGRQPAASVLALAALAAVIASAVSLARQGRRAAAARLYMASAAAGACLFFAWALYRVEVQHVVVSRGVLAGALLVGAVVWGPPLFAAASILAALHRARPKARRVRTW